MSDGTALSLGAAEIGSPRCCGSSPGRAGAPGLCATPGRRPVADDRVPAALAHALTTSSGRLVDASSLATVAATVENAPARSTSATDVLPAAFWALRYAVRSNV